MYLIKSYASVAQQVEQLTENPCRAGSIPAGGTKALREQITGSDMGHPKRGVKNQDARTAVAP